ncbi:hypothetical protein KP17_09420 [Pectobacterium parvum]|nr:MULTISPECIES: MFS transporter [Pectobacterium]KFX14791.1 hypothetical protein KP17_09420 [Pectobacterium parvum]GKW42586.1 hypothetical protein PEC301879_24440 [Pectobacterium carotovorum subsp. carotovorum]KHS92632.1 hypothetical protein RC88_14605 [Pectobacterium parvum]MCU1802111.1 MFS transporter [Pectobacterium parvum]QHQ26716.1 MFS transporter [Pectobacterium parvum]
MLSLTWYRERVSSYSLNAFLFSYSWFAILAILALYLSNTLALSSTLTALLIMTASVGAKVTRLIISPFIDVLPPQKSAALAAAVMGTSCLLLAVTHLVPLLFVAVLGYGVSYGSNSLLLRAIAGATEDERKRATLFVQLSIIANLASMLAPLVSIILFSKFSPVLPFYCTSMVMYALSLWIYFKNELPPLPVQNSWLTSLKYQIANKALQQFFFLTLLCWMIYSQLFSALPLYAQQLLNRTEDIGFLLSFNAILSVFLAPKLQRIFMQNHISNRQIIFFSLLMHAIGSLGLHFSQTLVHLYLSLTLWTLGELLLIPTLQTLLSGMTEKGMLVSVMAVNSIAMGLGEGIGGFLGVWLTRNTSWGFVFFSALSLFTALYFMTNKYFVRLS